MSEQIQRDLNPHKAAVAAMWLYSERYANQGGGSMTFWDSLTEYEQNNCRRMVSDIEDADDE